MSVVEQIPTCMLRGAGTPTVLSGQRVALDCGCAVYIGLRIDTGDAATVAGACTPDHMQLLRHFNLLLRESLVDPTNRPAADVVAELLDQAERYA